MSTFSSPPAIAQTQLEMDNKSGNGYFARMWRTEACPKTIQPRSPSAVLNRQGDPLLLFTHTTSGDGRSVVAISHSRDGGRHWSQPRTIYTADRDSPEAPNTLTRLRDGRLAAPFHESGQIRMIVSKDDGVTWSVSDPIDMAPLQAAQPFGQLVELDDELLMSVHGILAIGDDLAPTSGVLRSQDGGRSWNNFTVIACDRDIREIDYGPTAVHLDDSGTLLALISVSDNLIYRSISTDRGQSWVAPEQRLMAAHPALVSVGSTLACVNQIDGIFRVQFSENLFDSWRCDRMIAYNIRGQYVSAVALNEDQFLIIHDRGTWEPLPPMRGTIATDGLEVVLMQRNPAAKSVTAPLIPLDQRDHWEPTDAPPIALKIRGNKYDLMPKSSCVFDGKLFAAAIGKIHISEDNGSTFREIAQAPTDLPVILIGVLKSGRWLIACRDDSELVGNFEIGDGPVSLGRGPDGYDRYKLTGVRGTIKLWTYYSDDEGRTWHGDDEPMLLKPLVWAVNHGRLMEQQDGTVIMTVYGGLSDQDRNERLDCCGFYRSTDGGKSWGDFTLIAYDDEGRDIAYNEMDLQPMPDGTWVAVSRMEWHSQAFGQPSSSSVCFSTDQGRTWTKPQFAFIGSVPDLALLPDGGLLCATSFNKLRFSYDGGHTWSREVSSGTKNYPAVELITADKLLVHDVGLRARVFRRIPAPHKPVSQ